MGAGLNEEEHMKVRVSPQMNYLSRLSDNAKRSYDEDACSVNPPPSVHGAVALTDTGKHSGNAKSSAKKEAAAAYAEKIQEIMARAREQNQSPRSDAPGSPKAQPRAESVVLLTMTESSSLLERHPGAAEQGGAFARIEEPERSMAMVNRSTLLQDWLSEDVKQKAGSSGWNGWRPAKEMIGEIVQRWEWDQGVWLLKIAGQQSGPGEGTPPSTPKVLLRLPAFAGLFVLILKPQLVLVHGSTMDILCADLGQDVRARAVVCSVVVVQLAPLYL
jgi:hypothetical protein